MQAGTMGCTTSRPGDLVADATAPRSPTAPTGRRVLGSGRWGRYDAPHALVHPVGVRGGAGRVGLGIEFGGDQVLGAVESDLPVLAQRFRDLCHAVDVGTQHCGKTLHLTKKNLTDVVNLRNRDSARTQQCSQRKLDDLLCLRDDIGMGAPLHQHA